MTKVERITCMNCKDKTRCERMLTRATGTDISTQAQALIHRFALEWTFCILGILIMAAGIPCTLALKDRAIPGSLSRFDWSLLKNVPFLTLTMAGAVVVFVLFVPPFFLPLDASSIGLSASPGAGLVGGFGAATAVSSILGGWMCEKIGTSNTLMITVWSTRSACWRFGLSARHFRRYSFSPVNACANESFFICLHTVKSQRRGNAEDYVYFNLEVSSYNLARILATPDLVQLLQHRFLHVFRCPAHLYSVLC
jgi:hypothetical protein